MIAEPHVAGTRVRRAAAGHLDPAVPGAARRRPVLLRQRPGPAATIRNTYGIDFHSTLGQVIARNTDIALARDEPNVFLVAGRRPARAGVPDHVHHDDTSGPATSRSTPVITNLAPRRSTAGRCVPVPEWADAHRPMERRLHAKRARRPGCDGHQHRHQPHDRRQRRKPRRDRVQRVIRQPHQCETAQLQVERPQMRHGVSRAQLR